MEKIKIINAIQTEKDTAEEKANIEKFAAYCERLSTEKDKEKTKKKVRAGRQGGEGQVAGGVGGCENTCEGLRAGGAVAGLHTCHMLLLYKEHPPLNVLLTNIGPVHDRCGLMVDWLAGWLVGCGVQQRTVNTPTARAACIVSRQLGRRVV